MMDPSTRGLKEVAVIIPTLNGGETFIRLLQSLSEQTYQPQKKLVIDSQSSDGTPDIARRLGCDVISIDPADFNHGSTRQLGIDCCSDYEFVVLLTQDAVIGHPESLYNLISCFEGQDIAAAYGRQLSRPEAGPAEAFARFYNYPGISEVKSLKDAVRLGLKTVFISNSFAAYRVDSLTEVGGFPRNIIIGEDMYTAAKMIQRGWKISYCSEATVYHSHGYTIIDEFKRYFDTGVFHAFEPWIIGAFGKAEGEGVRFILGEIRFLWKNNRMEIPLVLLRDAMKLLGYHIGKKYYWLPRSVCKMLSMQRYYWKQSL